MRSACGECQPHARRAPTLEDVLCTPSILRRVSDASKCALVLAGVSPKLRECVFRGRVGYRKAKGIRVKTTYQFDAGYVRWEAPSEIHRAARAVQSLELNFHRPSPMAADAPATWSANGGPEEALRTLPTRLSLEPVLGASLPEAAQCGWALRVIAKCVDVQSVHFQSLKDPEVLAACAEALGHGLGVREAVGSSGYEAILPRLTTLYELTLSNCSAQHLVGLLSRFSVLRSLQLARVSIPDLDSARALAREIGALPKLRAFEIVGGPTKAAEEILLRELAASASKGCGPRLHEFAYRDYILDSPSVLNACLDFVLGCPRLRSLTLTCANWGSAVRIGELCELQLLHTVKIHSRLDDASAQKLAAALDALPFLQSVGLGHIERNTRGWEVLEAVLGEKGETMHDHKPC